MNKRVFLFTACLLVCLQLGAQEGIAFKQCSWPEALETARKENKLVFADVYTQWCGPCYNMAKNVFTLYSVGSFYNENFICMKVDAENGEGIALAKKYEVRSYPTYLFIDPSTGDIVHRSGSRQEPETFIYTGKCAIDPSRRSTYLEDKIRNKTSEPNVLIDYAFLKGSVYDSQAVDSIARIITAMPGYGLENPSVWKLFKEYVKGYDNDCFKSFISNYSKYVSIYGKEAEEKLYKEVQYAPEETLDSMPSFEGKDWLLLRSKADSAIRAQKYKEAMPYTDALMAYKGPFLKDVGNYLHYVSRSADYDSHPDFWMDYCLELCRFVAYNNPDRDDATFHQEYALQLEMKLKRAGVNLGTPRFGAQEYSMRPVDLKPKPKHK